MITILKGVEQNLLPLQVRLDGSCIDWTQTYMYVHTKVLIVFMLPNLGHIQENGEASYLGNFYDLLKKTITVLEMKKKSWILFKI